MLIKERKLEHKTAIESQIEKTKIINKATLDRIKSYGIEIEQIHNLADAEAAVAEMGNKMSSRVGKMTPEEEKQAAVDLARSRSEIEKNKQEMEEYKKLSQELIDSISSPNFGKVKDSSNSITDAKSAESLAWEKVTNEIKKYNNALTSLEDITSNAVKGSQERRDALHAENLKIKEQINYLKQQRDGLNTVSITTTTNGKLPNPIPGKELKDSFGAPRDGGSRRHEGIDIMAERGTEIHSTTSGKVLSAGNTGAKGGWGVTISDPQGNRHYYAHMNTDPSKILGIGQEILAGQVIGYVGDSGNAKGTPHLHYGITDANKNAINPYNLLTNNTTPIQKTITTNTSRSAIDRYKISPEIVNTVLSLAQKYNVDPALILAIGEQETNWGKSGDGKKGMYTGYGSYDSGSDYTKAGLEKQVEGTVKKMLAWGMSPGNVSFDRLNQGNKGNLPTGIYATDGNWQNSVWNLYKEFSNGQMTSTISGDSSNLSKSELSAEKIAEDRIKHQEEINSKILQLEKEFTDQSIEWYSELWAESENIQKELDNKISFSKAKQSTMSPDSQEYRDELELQIEYLKKKQIQKSEEAKQMDQAIINMQNNVKEAEILDQKIKDMKQGIIDGTFTDLQAIAELQSQRNLIPVNLDEIAKLQEARKQLSTDWWTLQNDINNTSFDKVNSKIEEFNNTISNSSNNSANLESELSMLTKGTSAYNAKLKEVIISHKQELLAIQNKRTYLEEQLMLVDKNSIAYKNLKHQLQEVISAEFDNKKALYDRQAQAAEEIVQIYKDVYNQQKDLAIEAEDKRHDTVIENLDSESDKYQENINTQIDATEKQIELLDKQHDKIISALDDQLSKYDEIYDAKLKLYDDKNEEQDYQSQLNELEKQKKTIQDSIITLKPDNSPETKSRIDDLDKELIAKNKEIDNLKLSHSRETIKNELNSQRDAYKKQIEAKKKSINDSYNLDKSNLDNAKQAYSNDLDNFKSFMQMKKDAEDKYYEEQKNIISDYYDNIINDERRWAKVREDVIEGNLSNIRNDFNNFGVYLNDNMKDIGTSITTNIIDKMKQAIAEARNLGSEIENINSGIGSNTGSSSYTLEQAEQLWTDFGFTNSFDKLYAKYKKQAEDSGYTNFWLGDDDKRLYFKTSDGSFIGTTDPVTGVQFGDMDGITPGNNDSGSNGNNTKSWSSMTWQEKLKNINKHFMDAEDEINRAMSLVATRMNSDDTSGAIAALKWANQLRYFLGRAMITNSVLGVTKDYNTSMINETIPLVDKANVYHTGGVVGNQSQSSSKIMDIVNRLFNVKPGEQVIKSLIGELEIPQKNVLSNFIPNMNNLVSSLTGNTSTVVSSPVNTYNLNINIDSMNGSKSDINNFATKIINGVKKLGG